MALALAPMAGQASAGADPIRVRSPARAASAKINPWLRYGLAIGRATFGPTCPSGITVRWVRGLPLAAEHGRQWELAAWAVASQCRIEFSLAVYRDLAQRRYAYKLPWFCTLVVHEYGHLAGRRHSRDPRNVMYPFLWGVYPPCLPR